MNCDQHRIRIQARGYRHDRVDAAEQQHLDECELCRNWYRDAVLKAILERQPVPKPTAGFVERALREATGVANTAARTRRQAVARSLAAALLLTIGGFLVAMLAVREGESANDSGTRLAGHRIVNVIIDAKGPREDATLTIQLAEDLELEGFADQHLIEWQTDLAKGRNLLALPVRSKTGAGGDIRVALSYDGELRKEMRIPLSAG